jgi:carbon storage regulator CsrA
MLILGRKVGQSIIINGNIVITALPFSKGTIRLGFEAPPSTRIDRKEVHDAKKKLLATKDSDQPFKDGQIMAIDEVCPLTDSQIDFIKKYPVKK